IIVYGNIEFRGRVLFDQDTAGTATILAGQTEATILFDKEFPVVPIINLTPRHIFDTKYAVTETTTRGFTIKIAHPQSHDISLNWIAIMTRGSRNSQIIQNNPKQHETIPAVSPSVFPTPTISIGSSDNVESILPRDSVQYISDQDSGSGSAVIQNNTVEFSESSASSRFSE
ncbi:MAG: hypothetical protein N3A54_05895, partial [Patescibacteria group bacterium]|nr:hypothetical protein [Patescibacteria group bacterium]